MNERTCFRRARDAAAARIWSRAALVLWGIGSGCVAADEGALDEPEDALVSGSVRSFSSLAGLDGQISSIGVVQNLGPQAQVGVDATGVGYKAVFTFDTSTLGSGPVEGVVLRLSVDWEGVTEECARRLREQLMLEIGPPVGFGGSGTITAFDYYAPAMVAVPWIMDLVTGELLLFGRPDLESLVPHYLNRAGLTQVRVSFRQPGRCAFALWTREAGWEEPDGALPMLQVRMQ
jgi:hypothetical protein